MKPHIETSNCADENNQMVDTMLNNHPPPSPPSNFWCSNLSNELQFADLETEMALNEAKSCEKEVGEGDYREAKKEENESMKLENIEKRAKNKRKRARSTKTSEEVESRRMTHITVERNRRKLMNEHLRVLRSLMPNSYVQRGDQASIIGGAIEFVRELEQLLQCLESQKRRRMYGNDQVLIEDFSNDLVGYENRIAEETAESKSCLADVEVKLIGFNGLIKILSRRRPGQLIKTIAALENLQLQILHTNITTIEQTVLYCFNVKMSGEARFTAEDIACSTQQILSFIHANSSML